jgi:hypothetical protein
MDYFELTKIAKCRPRLKTFQKYLSHDRMNYFSDTLTISLVLVLLFGSIALYLYTRIQQSEQKVSLLESILLDLKMSNEIKEYTELPAADLEEYVPYDSKVDAEELPIVGQVDPVQHVEQVKYDSLPEDLNEVNESVEIIYNDVNEIGESNEISAANTANEVSEINESVDVLESDELDIFESKVNYDTMHLKDLQTLAKSRGITGITKKVPLIEALKASDKAVKPGSSGSVGAGSVGAGSVGAGSGSFLETSASFSNESL